MFSTGFAASHFVPGVFRRAAGAAAATLFFLGLAPGLAAGETGSEPAAGQHLGLELNKLEEQGASCRAYLLFENLTGHAYSSLKLDLVMFDGDGIVARRLAVEGAPLPDGKTGLRVFDVRDVSCSDIGLILVNDVLSCEDGTGKREDCLAEIRTTSRGDISLIK